MKKLLIVFFKYFLFWLIYFLLSKFIFLLSNYGLTSTLTFVEIKGIFLHGFPMDISIASYLLVLPGILLAFSFILSPKILGLILKSYTLLLLIIVTFLNILDMGLYPHWGTRVGISAFKYAGDPKGVISNLTWFDAIKAILIFAFYFLLFNRGFNKFLRKSSKEAAGQKWFLIPAMLVFTGFLFIPIRGGLGTAPIDQSTVSFSNKLFVNHAASNFLWNFVQTIERNKSFSNPCNYTDRENALETFYSFENRRVVSDSLFIFPKNDVSPNVLLIILESFSNKVISSFGGKFGVCPNLDSLCSESVIFTSFYASGNRSDRGVSAILGGYPSLLNQSIMLFPEKSDKLTLMSDYFNRHDYQTSFYYGGDINFYNLKSFILQGDYDEIVSGDNFQKELQKMSSWGVPDGFLFQRVLSDIKKENRPFFTVAYTLSSHPPYDVPSKIIKGNSTQEKFLNSVAYSDSCIGDFIRELKMTNLWENTLVIITADHGALQPGPTEIIEPDTYRIPLIWTGGVIQNPGVINYLGGQPDLIPTLIHQLGWEMDSVMFGHDLFSTPSYAFYMLDTGWGYISNDDEFYFDQGIRKPKGFIHNENPYSDLNFAKAYLQLLHEDFLSK